MTEKLSKFLQINWKRIISLIALTSGLVPYISFWTQLPVNNLIHIVGAIFVLWILRSTYSSCCQRFRTSRTLSRHVPRLICVCFWLLDLYVLYLILRPIPGAFAGPSPSLASALALFSQFILISKLSYRCFSIGYLFVVLN